ncbi:MAG: hypothetical protein A3H28_09900 [Acidobacteria bacterium RIFCSPLOWO2_02_FULL_61_28]|nr:MAG: hypothetical protein A3H28_09900 [Acidobacteria bacterium RIFCSPLOWO2_02_FULL_61_28]
MRIFGQLTQRPAGVFLDDRVGMLRELFQDRPEFGQAGVAHRHGDVAEQTPIAGALDRAAAEEFLEFLFA